jgi:maltokinase-like protein
MALYHAATIVPTKAEMISAWAPSQPWGPPAGDAIDVIGSYRFDDPEGRVGMETHLVTHDGALLHVPMTYRDEPLAGADAALMGEMQHSALGTRWVYDGLGDPKFVMMLAAVAMTGQGEAVGMVEYEGRWLVSPSKVRIAGGGWSGGRVPLDGFELVSDDAACALLRNDRFEMTVFHRPVVGPRPAIGLTATWNDQPDPVVLAEIREHS